MPSAVPAVKAAVVAALTGLFPAADPTSVTYGDPGVYLPNEIVAVLGARTQVERPVMGTARHREELIDLDVVFSVFTAGGPEVAQQTTERAFTMLGAFADYFRTAPNETLGGACRDSWVSSYDLVETVTAESEADDTSPAGRLAEITAVLTARARI